MMDRPVMLMLNTEQGSQRQFLVRRKQTLPVRTPSLALSTWSSRTGLFQDGQRRSLDVAEQPLLLSPRWRTRRPDHRDSSFLWQPILESS